LIEKRERRERRERREKVRERMRKREKERERDYHNASHSHVTLLENDVLFINNLVNNLVPLACLEALKLPLKLPRPLLSGDALRRRGACGHLRGSGTARRLPNATEHITE
jgi:hypothetical protein